MRNLLAFLLFAPSLCLAQSVTLPYNPDVNADSAITSTDLLGLLPIFGGFFTPEEVLIDGMTINEYLLLVEENGGAMPVEGSEHGQMLYWNGEEWILVSVGENGQFLGLIDNTPVWQDLPTGAGVPEVGCADQTACNYDSGASVNWAPLCVYEDECGVCDGPGAIYECGCVDLPEGDCDCDGNQLDALNVCGGTCEADVDGDGICDDGDDCIGQADECGVCNGPGAIYECGCSEPDPEACDCAGNTLDAVGVCGGECTEDADGDGICDTEDTCIGGEIDACGICNGPGPIDGCGCEEIPPGECDCIGNVLDAVGTCGGGCQYDIDGDGICDDDTVFGCTYPDACNYDPSASIYDETCDFTSCLGCTDFQACNFQVGATIDNGSCTYSNDIVDCNNHCIHDTDGDGFCDELEVFGCTDEAACNYDSFATELDLSCTYPGCTDSTYCNYNPAAGCSDGSCVDGEPACLDPTACNFDSQAICSGVTCLYPGCSDSLAINFNPLAACDDGSCIWTGCTVPEACNFSEIANEDDGSCEFGNCPGCNNGDATNYNPTSTNDEICFYEWENSGQISVSVFWSTDSVRIEAWGAQGGRSNGGLGAYMSGDFAIPDSLPLLIFAGEKGAQLSTCNGQGNGGDGSYVTVGTDVLIVAGGGGGGVYNYSANTYSDGRPGVVEMCGTDGTGPGGLHYGPGGCDGNDGSNTLSGYYYAAPGNGINNPNPCKGGDGAPYICSNCCWGSGGGSGSGGGGYSGGGAGGGSPHVGGGGGSINYGVNQTNQTGVNSGHGRIRITPIH
jgi:hypothetical protein